MMERLLQAPPYLRSKGPFESIDDLELGEYDKYFITKLVKNWRSHPGILCVPNELFYECELEACANSIITDCMLGWDELPVKGRRFPMVFESMNGEDTREGNSPSWFNVKEAQKVGDWARRLTERRTNPLQASDIGIITPYRKQVERIRSALNSSLLKNRCANIKVGSVEEFQGQERKVIIISTVRSSLQWLDFDKDFRLGFVANPKRLNVALTRAKSLVIVIGNPMVLKTDARWAHLLQYIYDNGGCTGMAMPAQFTTPRAPDGGESDRPDAASDAADALADVLQQLCIVPADDVRPGDTDAALGAGEIEGVEMPRRDA